MKEIKSEALFSTNESIAKKYIEESKYPFEVLPKIKEFILELINSLNPDEYNIKDTFYE